MALAPNLHRRHCNTYGNNLITVESISQIYQTCQQSLMADRPRSTRDDKAEETAEAETSRKANEDDDDETSNTWLQLGLSTSFAESSSSFRGQQTTSYTPLLEQGLFHEQPRPSYIQAQERASPSSTQLRGQTQPIWSPAIARGYRGSSSYEQRLPLPFQQLSSQSLGQQQQQLSWALASSSSSPSRIASGLRVVSPPARPQAGVWINLRAAQNQVKEPFLPQIPKSYLRIKDGRLTIRSLMKYIANKLSLQDESEVDITCRGQQLHPLMTVQNVRDNIWRSTVAVELHPDSSTTDHIITLNYSRSIGG